MEKNNISCSQFVLVHGACHGSWCWYKVATLLRSAGHRVASVDLGASGIHPKQLDEIPTLSGYLEPLMELMAALPPEEKVVLVGHSMGGIGISVAAERFPKNVLAAVYIAAFMPAPGFNLIQLNQQVFDLQPDSKGRRFSTSPDAYQDSKFTPRQGPSATSVLFGPKFLTSVLYQFSPPEDLTLAMLLTRPFPIYRDEKSLKEATLTEENYGTIRRIYVVSKEDKIITEEIQRGIIENYPPHDVKEIIGSDHMVMFSKPQELSSLLQAIAEGSIDS